MKAGAHDRRRAPHSSGGVINVQRCPTCRHLLDDDSEQAIKNATLEWAAVFVDEWPGYVADRAEMVAAIREIKEQAE